MWALAATILGRQTRLGVADVLPVLFCRWLLVIDIDMELWAQCSTGDGGWAPDTRGPPCGRAGPPVVQLGPIDPPGYPAGIGALNYGCLVLFHYPIDQMNVPV